MNETEKSENFSNDDYIDLPVEKISKNEFSVNNVSKLSENNNITSSIISTLKMYNDKDQDNLSTTSKRNNYIYIKIMGDNSSLKIDFSLLEKGYPDILSHINYDTKTLILNEKWIDYKTIKDYFTYVKLSYCKNCPSGVVFSFGNNSHSETAQDDCKSVKYPLLIYKLKNIRIKKIQCGWEHNIIITNEKEIYSFGHNINYQCGIQYKKDELKKIKINNPINISILNNGILGIAAACGNEHTLILDENNDVYSFGNNEDGVLGVEDTNLKSFKFIKIDFGKYNKRIKFISAGTVHNLALTDDGKLFAWGSAQGGQLGLNEKYLTKNINKNFYISTPTLVPLKENNNFNKNMKIIKVSCGEAHTMALNDKNEVYSWGLSKIRVFTPQKIKTFENKTLINDIECGKTFSMFISSKGELFSCGVNDLYQLGIQESPPIKKEGQCRDIVFPTIVECFSFMKVEKISCGEAHCIAIIKDSSNNRIIWSWGNNRYGQLGLGDKIKFSSPTIVTFFFEYKENKFESISCGGFHSLCLIENNEDISWIENDFKNTICKIINNIEII